jgi:SAM-dependent methyltransferase
MTSTTTLARRLTRPEAGPREQTPDRVAATRAAIGNALAASAKSEVGVFRAIVEALALPPEARVLDIGCGSLAGTSTLRALVDLVAGGVVGLEKNAARIDPARSWPKHVRIERADAAYFRDRDGFDLVCLDLDSGQIYESLSLLAETVPQLVKPGGWVIARLVRRSRAAGKALRDIPLSARLRVERFLQENCGTLEPEPAALLRPLEGQGYDIAAVVPARFARSWSMLLRRILPRRWRPAPAVAADGSALPGLQGLSGRAWVVLRRREKTPVAAVGSAYRLARGEAFRLDEVASWLGGIAREIGGFCRPAEYFARLAAGERPVSLVKHDIHHDLRRAERMAAAEAEQGVVGVYFMMGPSPHNAAWFDLPYAWEALRRVGDMGHAIGYHVDVMDTIAHSRDLYRGMEWMLRKFAAEGLTLEAVNCHGNTNYAGTGLTSSDFFAETCRAAAPRADATFGPHVGAYSFAAIADRFGLRYWLDSQPSDAGRPIAGVTYVTDNSSALTVILPERRLASAKLDLDPAFQTAAAPILAQHNTLILLHPQFYE